MKAEPQALRLYVEVTVTRPVCRDAILAAQNHTKFSPVGIVRKGTKAMQRAKNVSSVPFFTIQKINEF